jgi:hypothetical protein
MENLVCDVQRVSIDGGEVAAPAAPIVRAAFGTTMLVLLWLIVGVPMLWGVFRTLQEVQILFQ